MGLDIYSSDEKEHFHIGYFSFTFMRSYFILPYGRDLYDDYRWFIRWLGSLGRCSEHCPLDEREFEERIGDLSILINHSDCDGILTSVECKKLLPCLKIDKDLLINALGDLEGVDNPVESADDWIKTMNGFISIVKYCAENDDVILEFG